MNRWIISDDDDDDCGSGGGNQNNSNNNDKRPNRLLRWNTRAIWCEVLKFIVEISF
jgi:hypothetical protein